MAGGLRLTEDEARALVDRMNRVAPQRAISPLAAATQAAQLVTGSLTTKRERTKKAGPSELELLFAKQITVLDFPPPRREHKFMENRDFRLDYAWPDRKLAVEVQGMVHRIRERFLRDVEKLAMAQIHGWKVLLVAGQDVRSGRAASWLVTLWEQK